MSKKLKEHDAGIINIIFNTETPVTLTCKPVYPEGFGELDSLTSTTGRKLGDIIYRGLVSVLSIRTTPILQIVLNNKIIYKAPIEITYEQDPTSILGAPPHHKFDYGLWHAKYIIPDLSRQSYSWQAKNPYYSKEINLAIMRATKDKQIIKFISKLPRNIKQVIDQVIQKMNKVSLKHHISPSKQKEEFYYKNIANFVKRIFKGKKIESTFPTTFKSSVKFKYEGRTKTAKWHKLYEKLVRKVYNLSRENMTKEDEKEADRINDELLPIIRKKLTETDIREIDCKVHSELRPNSDEDEDYPDIEEMPEEPEELEEPEDSADWWKKPKNENLNNKLDQILFGE